MSERDGWAHLYLYDGATGTVKNQITKGEWVVRGVVARGRSGAADQVQGRRHESGAGSVLRPLLPRQLRRHRADARSPTATASTRVSFSPDGKYYVDTWSRVDLPPVSQLRRASDGTAWCWSSSAAISPPLAAAGWRAPEVVHRQGPRRQDGHLRHHHPADELRSGEEVSGDREHLRRAAGSFVPKTFSAYYGMQALAELGFIVVQIDGMGTANRSKAFHDVACEEPQGRRLPGSHPVAQGGRRRSIRGTTSRASASTAARPAGRTRSAALLFHPRLLQGRRGVRRLPRQPHGQDLVERAVDGLADRPALRRHRRTSPTPASCRASCCSSSASSTPTSIRRRRCRSSTR